MGRVAVALIALAACKGEDLGPVHDGVSRVSVRVKSAMDNGYFLELRFVERIQNPPPSAYGIAVRAACQVGPDRLVDVGPPSGAWEPGKSIEVEDNAYITHVLPGRPSLCDLEFLAAGPGAEQPVGRVCWNDGAITEGACAPNSVPKGGALGLTAVVTKVTPEDADDLGFPAHLTIEYRATADRDMPRGSYLVRHTTCGGGGDDTWHSELQYLRAGETMWAGQNTYRLGRPAAGTECRTLLGFSPVVDGTVTPIAEFCHHDTTVARCP